jgi:HAD superfamily hydrolase (TIGR01490 family)
MTHERPLALFDLDGTLTRRDTLSDLLYHAFGPWQVVRRALPLVPTLLGVPLGRIHRDIAKTAVLRAFFGGMPEAEFAGLAREYATNGLPRLLRPMAEARLRWHIQQGHRVIVISASLQDWIEPWAQGLGIEVIASRAERQQGRLTGQLAGPNCRGEEKVRRLTERLDPQAYAPVYAYGDTDGDTAMLALADHPVYRGLR